ncbi:DUF4214 domain-containing protein [Novosphingobium lentum]|uniref:DUF4214 domain-containing protein n=1 Tax=Novosphingobium lentum TaxID=145287 RepID=UPI00082D99E2|nr:DUF4214 domain-containing protein [Novosphingobium lentum]
MTRFTAELQMPVERAKSLAELCAYEHSDFVRCAYLTVLGRKPDPEGMEFYLERLRRGVSKLTILRQLRFSAEAAQHDPGIAGFDRALKKHKQGNLPVVGPAIRMLTKAEPDGRRARADRALLRQMARVEARLLAIHIDCVDRLENIQSDLLDVGAGGAGTRRARREYGLSRAGGGASGLSWGSGG